MWTELRLITCAVSFFSFVLSYLGLFLYFSFYSKLKDSGETFVNLVKKSEDWNVRFFAPLMTLESIAIFLVIFIDPDESSSEYPIVAVTLLLWVISFIIIGKIHKRLMVKKHEALINELIIWNWIRILLFATKSLVIAMGIIDNLTL